jgi:hypothetical protein
MALVAKTPIPGGCGQWSGPGLMSVMRISWLFLRSIIRQVVDTAYDFGRESSWRAMHAVSLGHGIRFLRGSG